MRVVWGRTAWEGRPTEAVPRKAVPREAHGIFGSGPSNYVNLGGLAWHDTQGFVKIAIRKVAQDSIQSKIFAQNPKQLSNGSN